MSDKTPIRRKLIEVALPLKEINLANAYEKMPGIGPHPRGIHLWWARRPLAACRAVLFSSLVDDPSSDPDQFPTAEAQVKERERLFDIIRDLVKWENTTNETVLNRARDEILKHTNGNPPPVYDPFCGGGSIPLEAQRLGLEARGSDLNPVAVLITKALIEIPPKFADLPPVHPVDKGLVEKGWTGAHGLVEDVRFYGKWMRDEAFKKIGHLYPKVELSKAQGGGEASVIAWLWARTVKCPNPTCGSQMPLARTFVLSNKKGHEVFTDPIVVAGAKCVDFQVKSGKPSDEIAAGTVKRSGAICICCRTPVSLDYVREEGKRGRLSEQLMAIVAEGKKGRIYCSPTKAQSDLAKSAHPTWRPETLLPEQALGFRVQLYGMIAHSDLFTLRQLTALTTLCDILNEVHEQLLKNARYTGMSDDGRKLSEGGTGATAYADAITLYLAFALDRSADFSNAVTRWVPGNQKAMNLFGKQAIAMTWDFPEVAILNNTVGGFVTSAEFIADCLLKVPSQGRGIAMQQDAMEVTNQAQVLVSTDPPYYDNIGYADLSDFFYVWLRHGIGNLFPSLFSTMLVPKTEELVATPFRFGGSKDAAQNFFETGFRRVFGRMRNIQHSEFPLTVYYAFKQTEEDQDEDQRTTSSLVESSTGWETMLEGLISARLIITGTWPMRSEQAYRMVSMGTNALASSIVLACRPRPESAPLATRREFLKAIQQELPLALKTLQQGGIAPVDFAQAAIGPGMAIFTRYAKVLEADGSPMSVRTALQLINQELDAYLAATEGEFDSDTRFSLAWYEQYGIGEGAFGEADVLARAKNSSVDGIARGGLLLARAGKVQILSHSDEAYRGAWDPQKEDRLADWKCLFYLLRALQDDGEPGAGKLLRRIGIGKGETAKTLAYRLYAIADRKAWSSEATLFNGLVLSWPDILKRASEIQEGEQSAFL